MGTLYPHETTRHPEFDAEASGTEGVGAYFTHGKQMLETDNKNKATRTMQSNSAKSCEKSFNINQISQML